MSIAFSESTGFFQKALFAFTVYGASITPALVAAIVWKRATKAGAYASVIATTVTWIIFFTLSGFGGEYTVFGGVMPVAICWLAGAAAMIIVSLATTRDSLPVATGIGIALKNQIFELCPVMTSLTNF